MGDMLEYITMNLEEDPATEWKERDPDYKKKGVFRPFWQPDVYPGYAGLFDKSSLAPYGHIFYPIGCARKVM